MEQLEELSFRVELYRILFAEDILPHSGLWAKFFLDEIK